MILTHKLNLIDYFKEKFDNKNSEHTELLFKIWEILNGNRDIKLIDPRWCKINIQ